MALFDKQGVAAAADPPPLDNHDISEAVIVSNRSSALPRAQRAVLVAMLLCSAASPAFAAADEDEANEPKGDIVVTGHAATDSRAKQEAAPNIIQTVSVEEARRLPDLNAGEVISRLPGVTIAADSGVGHWINIRGLDADLTSTTLAGTHLPPPSPVTPQGGGRAFAFDAFPTGLIGSVTVTKTNRPDMDAEALGGTIEITPKKLAPNQGYFVEGRLGSGEQLSRSTAIADMALSAGIRFGGHGIGDGPFTLVGSLAYYQDALGTDDRRVSFANKSGTPDLAWSGVTQAYYQFHRKTKGATIELGYEPDVNTRLYIRYVNSGYQEDIARNQLAFKLGSPTVTNANGSLTTPATQYDKSVRDMLQRVSLHLTEVGGHHQFGNLDLAARASYAQGQDYRPYDTLSTFSNKAASGSSVTYADAGGEFPTTTFTGTDPFGTAGYKLSSVTNNSQIYRTREWSGGIDGTLATSLLGGENENIKFGVNVRLRTNTHVFNSYTSTSVPVLDMASAAPGRNILFDQSHYANGPNIDIDYMRSVWANGTGPGFSNNAQADAYASGQAQQDNRENVFAGYVQGETDFGALHLLAGLRVEHTDARYQGVTSVPITSSAAAGGTITNGKGSILVPVSSSSSYTNFFPSIQARYELSPSLIARASYSSTIARPGFNQINPSATIDAANNVVTTGNPNLKPITANSFDLSIEHYLPLGGIISAGAFDKELSNYIFSRTQFGGITDPVTLAVLGNQATPTQVITYANISHAWVRGIELNYDQHLSFLPGPLSNLGVSANYALIKSSADIRPGEKGSLPGTSKHVYNAAVYWDDGKLNLRAALSYNGRSLLSVGATRAKDQYLEDRLSLDIGASYAITDNVSIYASGRNLLNTAKIKSEGAATRITQLQLSGSAVMGGVNFKF
ncbi:TonB-dependent receptor [Novosphingobium resinovorum]|uniref:TonB-dependent receptor n=1 Tax=Novosphingobium resinovorum TaxID=158500 RepID=A0A031K1J0_9SPHN|nr:TonB-dependent receptor [Novosphingobium resinovorum]